MKSKEELNALKTEYENLNKKLNELTEEEVKEVVGGYGMQQFSITIDQAKETALKAVGLSAASVTFTKQKQEYDDGRPEYEIEFVANNMKYEFEINGTNGAIIKQEIESIYD